MEEKQCSPVQNAAAQVKCNAVLPQIWCGNKSKFAACISRVKVDIGLTSRTPSLGHRKSVGPKQRTIDFHNPRESTTENMQDCFLVIILIDLYAPVLQKCGFWRSSGRCIDKDCRDAF